MTQQTTSRFIRKTVKEVNVTVMDLEFMIAEANKKILARRSTQTDLALEAELRMCEIRRCLPLLSEL